MEVKVCKSSIPVMVVAGAISSWEGYIKARNEMAKQAHGLWGDDGGGHDDKPIIFTLREVQEAALKHFGVSKIDMTRDYRGGGLSEKRQIAMFACHHLTRRSLSAIGDVFLRDPKTVMHGIGKIRDRFNSGDAKVLADISAIEAIINGEKVGIVK